MWSAVGIIATFLLVFVLVMRKVNIGIALILGSTVLGLLSLPPPRFFQTLLEALAATQTWELVATVVSITLLNLIYQNTGKSKELAASLGKMIPSRSLVAFIPVLFGVLPVSGGALFSAPLVDSEGDRLGLEKEKKAFLNMWFRHIPHLLYPLETALVIASYLTGVSLATMILYQIPVFAIGIAMGYVLGLRGMEKSGDMTAEWSHVRSFLLSFLPILVAVILSAVLGVKVFIAVMIGVALLLVVSRTKQVNLRSILPGLGKMALLGLGIMIFRQVFGASGALDAVAELTKNYSFWPPVLLVSIPMVIGFALGEASPAITLSLSILLATYQFGPAASCLAYTCMYFGHLISPLHLCFAVTLEYFQTGTMRVYKRMIPATVATLSVGIPLMILLM